MVEVMAKLRVRWLDFLRVAEKDSGSGALMADMMVSQMAEKRGSLSADLLVSLELRMGSWMAEVLVPLRVGSMVFE